MAYEFQLEDPGEGIHEAEILELLVSKGDRVEEGDDVLVAETDKAAVDIPAPVSGEVTEIRVSTGDTVRVGDVLMVFEQAGQQKEASAGEDEAEEEKQPSREREPTETETDTGGSDEDQATGPSEAATSDTPARQRPTASDDDGEDVSSERGERRTLATPAVRGLARDHGVSLEDIEGSGEDGRILEEDVRKAAGQEDGDQARSEESAPAKDDDGEGERIPLRSIRRATARRMTRSWNEIPHVVHDEAIDITALERLRRDHAGSVASEGGKLTLTPLIVKALASALESHPRFNARLDTEADEIVLLERIDIGVAVDTERGLLAPVLRDVASRSVMDLAVELKQLVDRIRSDGASGDMLKGATFTFSNVGALGGTGLSPLISPPQVAILGAGRAELRQVVRGDLDDPKVETAFILPVSLSYDHRVNDGADAARFVNDLATLLRDPAELIVRG